MLTFSSKYRRLPKQWMNERTNKQTKEWQNERTNERTSERMNIFKDGMYEWINEWTSVLKKSSVILLLDCFVLFCSALFCFDCFFFCFYVLMYVCTCGWMNGLWTTVRVCAIVGVCYAIGRSKQQLLLLLLLIHHYHKGIINNNNKIVETIITTITIVEIINHKKVNGRKRNVHNMMSLNVSLLSIFFLSYKNT